MASIEVKPTAEERIAVINQAMTRYKDFPNRGSVLLDSFSITRNPVMFGDLISLMVEHIQEHSAGVEFIVGIDARGFVYGPLIAQRLGIGFVPIRRAGKLPGETIKVSCQLVHEKASYEVQRGCVSPGQKVIIVDDIMANGGLIAGACTLMKEVKADIVACMIVVELVKFNGRAKLPTTLHSLIKTDE